MVNHLIVGNNIKTRPVVSIGLPVYNGEATIVDAIESILTQTFHDFELIICDNASTDNTAAIVNEFAKRDGRIRYYRSNYNRGAAGNFNWAFELSRGEFFKWHAADDIILPEFLESGIAQLKVNKDVVLCFPERLHITFKGKDIIGEPALLPYRQLPANRLNDLSLTDVLRLSPSRIPLLVFGLIRRSVLAKTGLIGAFSASDVTLVYELRLHGRFAQIPKALYVQRTHSNTTDAARRLTRKGEATWFGAKNGMAVCFPEIKLFIEMIRAYKRAYNKRDRSYRYGEKNHWFIIGELLALRAHVEIRLAYVLTRKLKRHIFRIWSQITESFLSSKTPNLMLLRLWRCSAAMRRCQFKKFSVLINPQKSSYLLTEGLERLIDRGTINSMNVLSNWFMCEDIEKVRIATQAFSNGSNEKKIRFLTHLNNTNQHKVKKRLDFLLK